MAKILRKPNNTGRLIGWFIELSDFDLEYESRKAIKGQALEDFVVEIASFHQYGPVASQWENLGYFL